jgi:mersacidin/lichenicidin family type 2 lantibiotic
MSSVDIVRAWKDVEYRQSLSAAEQALLPEHPAGVIELADEGLDKIAGASTDEGCRITQLATYCDTSGCFLTQCFCGGGGLSGLVG